MEAEGGQSGEGDVISMAMSRGGGNVWRRMWWSEVMVSGGDGSEVGGRGRGVSRHQGTLA